MTVKAFVLDVDGVLTDGKFYYTQEGKVMKIFGADDNDALKLLDPFIEVQFVSGDKRGFPISKKRVEDMGYPISLVSTTQRIDWIKERWAPKDVIYMGDGIFDHYVFSEIAYSISPNNADPYTQAQANYVTQRKGSERAVAEAALHVLEKFFTAYNPKKKLRGAKHEYTQ
ncbi:phosphatase [Candidatus Marinamargulisbacteria bacterium SCGC AAA071-K20]|nr:phosphatase [Candidatus Marinamargulisbacteria bacterium SCGC AAA071-K20]